MPKEPQPFLDQMQQVMENVEVVLRGIRANTDILGKAAADLRLFLEQQWAKPLTVKLETPEIDKLAAEVQTLRLKVSTLEDKLKPLLGEPVKTITRQGKR